MYYYKINNLVKADGMCDYKGLDIKQFVFGSQVYPEDFGQRNYCLISSPEEITENPDVQILTDVEYETLKADILTFNKSIEPVSDAERIAILEQKNAQLEEIVNAMMGV